MNTSFKAASTTMQNHKIQVARESLDQLQLEAVAVAIYFAKPMMGTPQEADFIDELRKQFREEMPEREDHDALVYSLVVLAKL